MNSSLQLNLFWQSFLVAHPQVGELPRPAHFYFCDNAKDANICADLVVQGVKQATAASLWWYTTNNETLPKVGNHYIIINWSGVPKAVIQTADVSVMTFGTVDSDFAYAEGEGDRSLAFWQDVHRSYYARELGCDENDIADDFEIVCHRFKTVYRN